MNPVRSLAPALVSHHLEHVWLYLIAPILGASSSVLVWNYLVKSKN
jgi:aquaporin NIP